jgi:hypothetical protein
MCLLEHIKCKIKLYKDKHIIFILLMFDWLCQLLNIIPEPEIIELTREQMDNHPNWFMMYEKEYHKFFEINDAYNKVVIRMSNNMTFTTSIDNMIQYAEQNYNHPFIFKILSRDFSLNFYRVINAHKKTYLTM